MGVLVLKPALQMTLRLKVTARANRFQPGWNPRPQASVRMWSIRPIVGKSSSVVHSCCPQHSKKEHPMFAAQQVEEAEDDGFVDLPADLMSEIEHCYAAGVRRGDWPPCPLGQFMIALMRVGSRSEG